MPSGPSLADLERRAKAAPTDVPTKLALGDAYLDQGRLPDAASMYQGVLALDKDNISALNGLAVVLFLATRPVSPSVSARAITTL